MIIINILLYICNIKLPFWSESNNFTEEGMNLEILNTIVTFLSKFAWKLIFNELTLIWQKLLTYQPS